MSFIGLIILIKVIFSVAQAIAVFTKTNYAAYILFILSSVPPAIIYLYNEREKFKSKLTLRKLRLWLYLISYPLLVFPYTYPFRFLAIGIYGYGLTPVYLSFLAATLITLSVLGGLNETQGVLLTYGIGIMLSFAYQALYAKLDYILLFCEGIVFWCILIPLFYTQNHYIWILWVSSWYGVLHLFLQKSKELPEKEEDNDDEYNDLERLFCNAFWEQFIFVLFQIVAGFWVYVGILYGMSIEQFIPYSLF